VECSKDKTSVVSREFDMQKNSIVLGSSQKSNVGARFEGRARLGSESESKKKCC
jgi:hypothetical protein